MTYKFPVDIVATRPTSVKTSAYTAVSTELVLADATAGGFTVTLPTPENNAVIVVKKTDSSVNAVSVARSGSDVFNQPGGDTTLQLTQYGHTA